MAGYLGRMHMSGLGPNPLHARSPRSRSYVMQCFRSFVVAASLLASGLVSPLVAQGQANSGAQASQAGKAKTSPKPGASFSQDVADLIARIEKKQRSIQTLQLSLEIVTIERPAGNKPHELRALISYYGARGPKGARTRLDADWDTPHGLLRSEKVRTAEGVWMHTKSALVGEKWIQIDKRTMERLDKAQRIFGGQNALPTAGSRRLGAVVGAELLRGLARDYTLALGKPLKIGAVECHCVEAKLKKTADPALVDLLPQARASLVQLYFSKDSLLLQKFVEITGQKVSKSITVRSLQINPKVDEARFVIRPPESVRWVDILSDKLFSVRAKMELERLREYERDQEAGKRGGKTPKKSEAGTRKGDEQRRG